jgi:hypothetical protein
MNIVGLGKAGCNIAELFKQYPQYTVFKFDTDEKLKRKKNCFYIPQQGSVELYDANPIDLKRLRSNIEKGEEAYLILCGSGKVAGSTLWISKELTDLGLPINLIYINPDPALLDAKSKLRHRAHFHILQQYARSGAFEKIYLLDNTSMSQVAGKTSILNYYNSLNQLVVSTVHWLNVYNNTESVFDTYKEGYVSSRIATFSILDVEEEEEKEYFSLEKCNQIKYFYGFNRITIENDDNLLEKVNRISQKNVDENTIISYGIFPTDLEVGFSFALKSSSHIQEQE